MKHVSLLVASVGATLLAVSESLAAGYTLIGWNDLGMHCTDGSDFSVFSILPHYNTIHAQLLRDGSLVTSPGAIEVSYEAVADLNGSINRTSIGKGNFWDYVQALYGADVPPDTGLAGFAMPGADNTPQAMEFSASFNWFTGEGIPLTPYDDAGAKNYYPMMRLVARDAGGTELASTDIVLPVSDEMDCRVCHASGINPTAKPTDGYAWACDADHDYKLNILRLHDEFNRGSRYRAILTQAGYDPDGLYATVKNQGTPVLCAHCHASNALPGTGINGVPPLTEAIHGWHAWVTDPATGMTLNDSDNRAACYRCHPGQETRCLRGAMGSAVAADGTMSMQCQSCHGSMLDVGAVGRVGWLAQPNCQACHTGTALQNNGAIRYLDAHEPDGSLRQAVNQTFATNPNTPDAGFSLYRFSAGHGGLQCEACHGSTHAEFPSTHANDNVQSTQLQGHAGMLSDCTACHASSPRTTSGGPHGMHPVGADWVNRHEDAAEDNPAQCRVCHGTDYRGTVLSRSLGDRTLQAFGTKRFWRGFQIGCYTCHDGPHDDDASRNRAPVVATRTGTTEVGEPVAVPLSATDADGDALTLRIVNQPAHGTVALQGATATYFPYPGFSGQDAFTYAAWDGATDSNLAEVSLTVGNGACGIEIDALVPAMGAAEASIPFRALAALTGCSDALTYHWQFDDGASVDGRNVCHVFATAGEHTWTLEVKAGDATETLQGTVQIEPGAATAVLSILRRADGTLTLAWSTALTGYHLQSSAQLGPHAAWQEYSGTPAVNGLFWEVTLTPDAPPAFFRLMKP